MHISFSKGLITMVVAYVLSVLTIWGLADEMYFKYLVWALLGFVWSVPAILVISAIVVIRRKMGRGDLIMPNENGDYPIIRQKVRMVDEMTGKRVKREVYANPNLMPASYYFGKEFTLTEMRQVLLNRITSGNFGSLSKKIFDQVGGEEEEPPQLLAPVQIPELQAPAQSLVIQSVANQLAD